MKKMLSLTLALALMAALFTGCGCAANVSTHPGGMITEESTRPSIMPMPTATRETTRPQATSPTAEPSQPTEGTGAASSPTGAISESTESTDNTMMPKHRNRNTDR